MAEKKTKPAQIKTKPTPADVAEFIAKIPDEQKRKDCQQLAGLMQEATGDAPVLWGSSIIGFGNRKYVSARTGREVDWMRIGFSPRKANFSLYIGAGSEHQAGYLKQLGKHKMGVGCLYINKLADVDMEVLNNMIKLAASRSLGE